MPQPVDPAVPTMLLSLSAALAGKKLRVAGRMLSYNGPTGLVLLEDRGNAVLVDVSLCLDTADAWARERKGVVMALGYLEQSPTPLPIPILPAYAPAPEIDPLIVLRAVLVTPAADLDMGLWNAVIEECGGGT